MVFFFKFQLRRSKHNCKSSSTATSQDPVPASTGRGMMIVVLIGAFVVFDWCVIRHFRQSCSSVDNEFERVSGTKKISYEALVSATNHFDEARKLGEGGFGPVFKGYLNNWDTYVAVKRISESTNQGISEYIAEVKILSQLRHRNLVQLVGWCHEKKDILLVYEFIPNRSLDYHLFSGESLLKWEQRYKIVQGLAYGLQYLKQRDGDNVFYIEI